MRKAFNGKLAVLAFFVSTVVLAAVVFSHCQIPCGIYNDPARFDTISEHITTIEKSMKQITELSRQDESNTNQIIRWVQNKEKHADDISHIVTYYFMAQRIKPVDKSDTGQYELYVKKLMLLHEMLFYSMKAKQTTDLSYVGKLRGSLGEFRKAYFAQYAH
ncbi:MAG: superoxide dismutase [Ni] [Planctomycetota bacterium]|jgi:nickel superoxide dismutase